MLKAYFESAICLVLDAMPSDFFSTHIMWDEILFTQADASFSAFFHLHAYT